KAMSQAAEEFAGFKESTIKTTLDRLEASNRDLEHFAAIAAHDLKSHLASISNYAELIKSQIDDLDDPNLDKSLKFILAASERMRNLIDRILEYAHLTNKAPVFHNVDLNGAYNMAALNLAQAIEQREAMVNHEELPVVWG